MAMRPRKAAAQARQARGTIVSRGQMPSAMPSNAAAAQISFSQPCSRPQGRHPSTESRRRRASPPLAPNAGEGVGSEGDLGASLEDGGRGLAHFEASLFAQGVAATSGPNRRRSWAGGEGLSLTNRESPWKFYLSSQLYHLSITRQASGETGKKGRSH